MKINHKLVTTTKSIENFIHHKHISICIFNVVLPNNFKILDVSNET